MQPFNAPVQDFIILPATQQDFNQMLDDMTSNKTAFEKAVSPYQNNVTVIVCADVLWSNDTLNHCPLEYFLEVNNINLEQQA